jgi:hypothetical protein
MSAPIAGSSAADATGPPAPVRPIPASSPHRRRPESFPRACWECRSGCRCSSIVGYRWYLWVFHCAEVVVFVLAAGRSHDVPEEHFGPVEGRGILVVDRYKAYQAIDKVKSGRIVLAFCWAHVRRDFVRLAKSWPDQER